MDVLTEKRYRTYARVSRYSPFPYFFNDTDKRYVYGTTAHLTTEDTPYVNHKVKSGETYDSIALYYYNNPTYYWIICDFNRIQDPYKEPEVDTVLKIPTFSAISYEL